MRNPIIKNAIISILAGVIVTSLLSIWFDVAISGLVGFITTISIIAVFIAKVWIREFRLIFSGNKTVYRNITIWKGFHRPFPWFVIRPLIWNWNKPFILKKIIKFTSASLLDEDRDNGVNKLFGFFVGGVHKNSWRWGYRQDSMDNLYFVVYTYNNGYRANKKEIPIRMNKDYKLGIIINKDTITFTLDGNTEWSETYNFKRYNLGFLLGTYIGGEEPANRTIKIQTR